MRVLFVKPENYKAVCNLYDRLKEVKNHPKTTVICQSPEEFRAQFDKDKFGVRYTTFYFDEEFGMINTVKCFKEFVRLYGDEDARYISEAMKMRTISIDRLLLAGDFNVFKGFCIDPCCIDDVIRSAKRPLSCKSLL